MIGPLRMHLNARFSTINFSILLSFLSIVFCTISSCMDTYGAVLITIASASLTLTLTINTTNIDKREILAIGCDGTNICKQEWEGGKLKTTATIITIYEDGLNEIIDKNEYNESVFKWLNFLFKEFCINACTLKTYLCYVRYWVAANLKQKNVEDVKQAAICVIVLILSLICWIDQWDATLTIDNASDVTRCNNST